MKVKHWLAVSIAVNVGLAVCLLLALRPAHTFIATAPSSNVKPEASTPSSQPARALSGRDGTKNAGASANWVQTLRNAGIAEKVIADVAAADFESRWQKRSQENQKKFERGDIDHAALMRLDLEHDAEQEKELRAALGDDGFRRWDQTKVLADLDRAGLNLTGGENDELYDLRKELDRKRTELDKARQQGKLSDEDAAAQSSALYAKYNEQLLKLLGEDRYALLQSDGNTGLGDLHRNLSTLSPDDAQVAGMETAQQTWNARRGRLDAQFQTGKVTAEEYQQQLKSLEAERDQEYQKVLGPAGYAAFQKAEDPRYQAMKRVGPGWGMSDIDINNLYAAIQNYEHDIADYRQRAQAIEAQGQTVDWPAIEKTLRDFSQQTENALRSSLGDTFDKLKRSNVLPFER